jgi:hypothetical protein
MNRYSNLVGFLLTALVLGGCGPSIWSVNNKLEVAENFDGALMSYALASGELQFSAAFTTKDGLTLTSDQQVKAVPDFNHQHVLAYNHQGLSSDDVSIDLDGALLQQVSSTTEDKSVATILAVNALLTQAAATQKAIAHISINAVQDKEKPPAPPPTACTDMKVSRGINVTYQTPLNEVLQQRSAPGSGCELHITVKPSVPKHTLGVFGFPRDQQDNPTEEYCDHAVCFRLAGTYHIVATATAKQNGKLLETTTMAFDVLAPRPDQIGFVRFNRRAFVQNTTTIQWKNGIVSHFAAKNPSEVFGFIGLPTALLGTAAVTAALIVR